jgi:hypothetical protein
MSLASKGSSPGPSRREFNPIPEAGVGGVAFAVSTAPGSISEARISTSTSFRIRDSKSSRTA